MQLKSLRYEPSGSVDELTGQLICKLMNALTTKDAGSENSITADTTITVNEKITELITKLINLTNEPIQISDNKYLDQIMSELINELIGSKDGDTIENTNSSTKVEYITIENTDSTAKAEYINDDNKVEDENNTIPPTTTTNATSKNSGKPFLVLDL